MFAFYKRRGGLWFRAPAGARPQAAGVPLLGGGLRSRALPAADAARRSRGSGLFLQGRFCGPQQKQGTATRGDSIKNKAQSFGFFTLSARPARRTLRWARGGGRGFRFPLPTPSGLPTHPNDQGLNPGPKRGSRSVQRPEKTIVLGPWKLSGHQTANVFFLIGLCPPLRFYHRIPPAAHSGTPSPAGSPPWGSELLTAPSTARPGELFFVRVCAHP